MKRLLSLILATLVGANYSSAGIRITVPQKWKGKTLYIWQTDINQAMKRNADEPVHQVRDTVEIKELTFDIPLKLDVATKVNVMTPKRNESDFDHTIGEACILPGEDVHMILDENIVKNEGSLLNKQMAEIYTYYMRSMARYHAARECGDNKKIARLADEYQQWYCDWIRNNPAAPGASYALYQLSDPSLIVEYSALLQDYALKSLFYPYAENHISRAQCILERRAVQRNWNEQEVKAPDFTLNNQHEEPISLSDFKGKWVILDFWGTWCAPCLNGMPELKEIYRAYNGKIEIVGIDCNDTKNAWQDAVARLALPWVSLYQPEGGEVSSAYHVTAFPTKVVITPDGVIKKIYSGASPTFKSDLENWLK